MGGGCGEGGEDGEGGGRRGGGGQYERAVLGAACRPTKAVCPGAAPRVGVVGDRCACAHATQLAGAPWVPRCVFVCVFVSVFARVSAGVFVGGGVERHDETCGILLSPSYIMCATSFVLSLTSINIFSTQLVPLSTCRVQEIGANTLRAVPIETAHFKGKVRPRLLHCITLD